MSVLLERLLQLSATPQHLSRALHMEQLLELPLLHPYQVQTQDPLYMHAQENMEEQVGYTTPSMENWNRTQEFSLLTS